MTDIPEGLRPPRPGLRDVGGRTYAIEVGDYFRNRDGEVEECPYLQDAQVVAYFLHFRVRKPAA